MYAVAADVRTYGLFILVFLVFFLPLPLPSPRRVRGVRPPNYDNLYHFRPPHFRGHDVFCSRAQRFVLYRVCPNRPIDRPTDRPTNRPTGECDDSGRGQCPEHITRKQFVRSSYRKLYLDRYECSINRVDLHKNKHKMHLSR